MLFRSTQVKDLTPLTQLTGLKSLDLWKTQVSDLTSLAQLAGLRELYLGNTQVSDIASLSAISGLTVYVETDERAKALRRTLAAGSKVEVRVS